ncbi:serine/threonine-protein kinase [Bifidobacterium sp. ESL0769]|uniref:serine/threonine protein kinase n=1 Tax=Bifidobacterium sp. ESL0769 TaxID=2983229 RepID=UPI0023F8EE97|nr:serine/threonine-protein kinase [Bifidobacterium sp. ESL0769]WEV67779.1 serine/threonine-protein kinase [Bifidobacterium sp. ESL0769]
MAPTIPDCDFIRELGAGSTADVYLYRQHNLNREVAVKVGKSRQDRTFDEAFEKEAKIMAQLSAHPYIVSIYGSGLTNETRLPYLVLEYAPHGSYKEIMHSRRLSVSEVLDLGVKLSGALQTAHRHGIIHRDIKPANILVTSANQPALSDFGISTSIYEAKSRTGFSVPWAPPEVLTGKGGGTETSDIYSLAATLYGLLAGKSPYEYVFHPHTQNELARHIVADPLPKNAIPDVPKEVEQILLKAMDKDPDARYLSAQQFGRALQQAQEECGLNMTPFVAEDCDEFPPHHSMPQSSKGRFGAKVAMPERKHSKKPLVIAIAALAAVAIVISTFVFVVMPRMDSRKSDDRTQINTMQTPHNGGTDSGNTNSNSAKNGSKGRNGQKAAPKDDITSEDAGAAVPQATNLKGTSDGQNVTFTWSNPAPKAGDTYAWAEVQDGSEAPGSQTSIVKEPKVSLIVNNDKPQTCIQVSIVRVDGHMSATPAMACVVTK